MIDYEVLYYPDFSPDCAWLRRVLMFADSVVRIVPSDVDPNDTEDLRRLQDAIPGCLRSEAPRDTDVAVEDDDRPRLVRAFDMLGQQTQQLPREVRIIIGRGGELAIDGHVFVHDRKLSYFIKDQLTQHGLMLEELSALGPSEDFLPIRREASDLILASLASRMARRLGVDAITDQPLPFSIASLQGVSSRARSAGEAEGALLSALASIMIPTCVTELSVAEYRAIRGSYAEVREAFKGVTTELTGRHRLGRLDDPETFAARVESVARDFSRQYENYRASEYARRFAAWGPMCIGGVLSVGAAFASPVAAAIIGVASFGLGVLERLSEHESSPNERVFHMLAGLRGDIIARSGLSELI